MIGCAIFEESCSNQHDQISQGVSDWQTCGSICGRYDYYECQYWSYRTSTRVCKTYKKCEPVVTDIRDIRGSVACFSGISIC